MEVTVIQEGLDGFENAVLVKRGNEFYVVSSVSRAFDTGLPETLAFPSTEDGEVTSWLEVAGGRLVTRGECIKEMQEEVGPERPTYSPKGN